MILVRRLDGQARRDLFDCGVPALDDWLRRQAGQAESKRLASVWIAFTEDEPSRVLGYYSLAPWQISFEEAPAELTRRLPRYPIAASLLARLAVDRSSQGRGVGRNLLVDALSRAHQASLVVPVQAVVVHAKDEKAAAFYRSQGLTSFPDRPLHFYVAMATLDGLFRQG